MPMVIMNESDHTSVDLRYMTELGAVNMALLNAGESPVSTLKQTRNINAIQAQQALHDASRDVQLEGWHFNTELNVKLEVQRPTPGIIPVPANALRVDINPRGPKPFNYVRHDVIQRGNRLYDMQRHTDKFDSDIFVNITYFLPFEEMPEAARYYTAIKAARRFRQSVTGGDDGMGSLSEKDELRARNTLMREDSNGLDLGFLTPRRNTLIGHDMARVLRRRL